MHMLATLNNALPTVTAASTSLGAHDVQVLIVAAVGIAIVVLLIQPRCLLQKVFRYSSVGRRRSSIGRAAVL